MLHHATKLIRERFHPLFALRRNRFFVERVMPLLDVTLRSRLYRVDFPVYLRTVRHLSLIANSRITEPGVSALLAAITQVWKPRTFWDVGANMGLHSWRLLTLDPQLHVLLFEPDPINAELIRKTINAAALQNRVHLRQEAVSDTQGTSEFALDPSSGATGSLITDNTFNERLFGQRPACISVTTVRLDDVCEQLADAPDLIKIDVELAEHLVIRGANQLLSQWLPTIVFECAPANQVEILSILRTLGYQLVGADHPDQPLEGALNLLAVPPQNQPHMPQLMSAWRQEYQSWT